MSFFIIYRKMKMSEISLRKAVILKMELQPFQFYGIIFAWKI